jgi:hypothetical protein
MAVAINRKVEPYRLDPKFEGALVALLCQRPKLFARIGHALDPECLGDERAKVFLRAAKSIAADFGVGPDSTITVFERMRDFLDAGRLTQEIINECMDYLDAVEDRGLPNEEHVAQSIIPVLRERAQTSAMHEINDALGKRQDIRHAV